MTASAFWQRVLRLFVFLLICFFLFGSTRPPTNFYAAMAEAAGFLWLAWRASGP